MKLVAASIIVTLIILISSTCTREQIMVIEFECGEEITYNDHIREVIQTSCAYARCHAGTAPGDFTNYSGIAIYINGGLLERRVVMDRSMPPANAQDGPTSLTEKEIELFGCWIDAGYPEN
jgi:uncharacterized membrane protein